MNKWKQNTGLTLMELLAALLVMTLLVTAMGTGMDTALDLYRESMMTANGEALAGILETTLEDVLRYAGDIRREGDGFTFTNVEYGIHNGCLRLSEAGTLQVENPGAEEGTELLNEGVYALVRITEFAVSYVAPGADGTRGGYFAIRYTIEDADCTYFRTATITVRPMNPD